MKAKKVRNRKIKLEVGKFQKAALLKASPPKKALAAKGAATGSGKRCPLQVRRLHPRRFLHRKLQARRQYLQKCRRV